MRPLGVMEAMFGGRFYWNHINRSQAVDAELARDPRTTLRRMLYAFSGDNPESGTGRQPLIEPGQGWLDTMPDPEKLPDWLTEADLDSLTEGFAGSFTGALNWYRNIDRNWELTSAWHGAVVSPPALYVYGDRDLVAGVSGHAPTHRAAAGVDAEPAARSDPAGGLRPLDAAGTAERGQRGTGPVPHGVEGRHQPGAAEHEGNPCR